jgi:hypothetical protein
MCWGKNSFILVDLGIRENSLVNRFSRRNRHEQWPRSHWINIDLTLVTIFILSVDVLRTW